MSSLAITLQEEVNEGQLLPESDFSDNGEADCTDIPKDSYASAKYMREAMKAKAKEYKSLRANETLLGETSSDIPEMTAVKTELHVSHNEAKSRIPVAVYNHLAWIITDASPETDSQGRVSLPEHLHERVLSIAQDLMGSTTRLAMPKHVGLGLHILKQTRSKDLLTVVSRFGNAVSYDEAQRYITGFAHSAENQIMQDGIFIPANILFDNFTQVALDNLDFNEDTKEGKTMHATTHFIYQYPQKIR